MAVIRLKMDTTKTGAQLLLRFNESAPVLKGIGALVVADSQTSFKNQRLGAEAWAPRQAPNVAGIVGDLNVGRTPPSRRFSPRPALIDTGRLRQSINFRVGEDSVTVGSALQYAALMQEGGKSKVRLTATGKEGLKKLLSDRPDLKGSLGFLFQKSSFEVNVRARKFIGVEGDTLDSIVEILRDYYLEGQL